MKIIKFIKYMFECHAFFVRKSQHYILGNWKKYYTKSKHRIFGTPYDKKLLRYYNRNYLKAWCKFMYLSISDYKKIK